MRMPSWTARPKGLVIAAAALLITAAILLGLATRLTPIVRDRAVEALEARFDGEVQLDDLHVAVFPRLRVEGRGLVLQRREPQAKEPLIRVGSFFAEAGLVGLLSRPMRISRVQVDEMVIHIPPRDPDARDDGDDKAHDLPDSLVVHEVRARQARLEIGTRKADREPRVFDIHDLRLTTVARGEPMQFEAELTNPVPRGDIHTTGRFGPWERDDPSLTPVSGEYTFEDADLGTIDGIAGTLSSTGRYEGVLERIVVRGTTHTPDFRLDTGDPVPLTTAFEAVVDGTDGDTHLERIEAEFLETRLTATGAVVGAPNGKGRDIRLEVELHEGRVEDALRLAIRSKAPLEGNLRLDTKLRIPPGPGPVVRKLQLDGTFSLAAVRFTDLDVQRQIDTLSTRGRGMQGEVRSGRTASDMGGRFRLRNGEISFDPLMFSVEGATVRLTGGYHLVEESVDFRGNLLLHARLSETVGGWKSWVAKPFDPLFRRGGKTVLPIKVTGPRDDPEFGLDVRRVLLP
jgi:hypothetical protein